MRALVTGDKGFLGRHFSEELRRRGYDVIGCDVKTTRSQDCRNLFRRDIHMRDMHEWDLVVHCAAVVGGRQTIENDPLSTAESLSIDAEMFRWAAKARPGRVLYLSSSAAYPVELQRMDIYQVPYVLKETDIRLSNAVGIPDQVYGWSKIMGEILAGKLREAGVPVTVVRPFSGYGEDQDPTYPFRAFIDRARLREDPFNLWCYDCTRDFIHVDDLVNGALAVADSGTEDPVNLCTGRPVSFGQLAAMCAMIARYEPRIRANPDAPKGVEYRVGDPTRMLTYYKPKITLEDGVRRALGFE